VKVKKTSRGEQLLRRNWEEKPPCASAVSDMVVFCAANNTLLRRTAMREAQRFNLMRSVVTYQAAAEAAKSPAF
jgi:hypothetical protein